MRRFNIFFFCCIMGSITYLTKFLIVIISFQLTFVNTGNVISGEQSENDDNKSTAYEALEVIKNKKGEIYLPMQDINLQKSSSKGQKFMYFCLTEKRNADVQALLMGSLQRVLLFPVKSSNKREKNKNLCSLPVTPMITNLKRLCGENNKGLMLRLQFELFYQRDTVESDPAENGDNESERTRVFNIEDWIIKLPIYTFCFQYKKRKTAFVTYNIVSTDMNEKQFPEKFHVLLPSIDKENKDDFQQQGAPLCYKKENQNLQEEFGDSITNLRDDYLVEQMMASWQDIEEDLERGSIQNYINVAPQWKSIRDDWNKLSTFIKRKSMEQFMKLTPTENQNIYIGFQVTCGTYGEFKHIRLGKLGSEQEEEEPNQLDQWDQLQQKKLNDYLEIDKTMAEPLLDPNEIKSNAYVSPHPNETKSNDHHLSETSSSEPPKQQTLILTAPLYWWKFISYKKQGIVFIMPNIPKSMPELFDKYEPLCIDICEQYGWQDVKTFNQHIMCCEATQELLGKLISSNANSWEWEIPTTILNLT